MTWIMFAANIIVKINNVVYCRTVFNVYHGFQLSLPWPEGFSCVIAKAIEPWCGVAKL